MKAIYALWIAFGIALPFAGFSQHVMGTVNDVEGEPLSGASVIWLGTDQGTMTDEYGVFHLNKGEVTTDKLVISYVGYQADTVLGEGSDIKVVLYQNGQLKEAVVKKRRDGVIISDLTSVKREIITTTELRKAACCDLAGAFSTQASVKAQTTNVLTNSKELRISGLSGVYNQVLVEGFPLIQGLTYTYGISSVPGTLVKNIFISKGANSVLQGYESITGQVNVITLDPSCAEKGLFNVYVNSFGENQYNGHLVTKKGDWHTITAAHVTQPAMKIDQDKDGFMDLPQISRYQVWTRTKYKEEDKFGWSTRIGGRLMKETRLGGQVNFNPELHKGGNEYYGQLVDIEQGDFMAKTAYRFSEDSRIVLFNSIASQRQTSWYGQTSYKANQNYFYNNIQHEQHWAGKHLVKSGVSYRHFDLFEDIQSEANGLEMLDQERKERVWGVFAENELNYLDNRLTILTGVRADHHNQFGLKVTPRGLVRFRSDQKTTWRLNAGKGWRTVNLFPENIRMLIGSRQIRIADDIQPEEAWNFGLSVTRKYAKGKIAGYVTIDVNLTNFSNQIFPQFVNRPNPVIEVDNFYGISRSSGAQAEAFLKLMDQFEFKVAYNYLKVFRIEDGDNMVMLPFNNKHRLLGTFSWAPTHGKFHWDFNAHWFGPQKMPETNNNPESFRRPSYSRSYSLMATQFTYNFPKWEWYLGCENLLDFRQERPIISWEDPFGDYFDTSSVWGPTRGREVHIGFRYFPFR